jgi:cytochrome c biogenesis protein CcmG, thiol:disulfide interchange protein DsbE
MSELPTLSPTPEPSAPPVSRGGRIMILGITLSWGALIAWVSLIVFLVMIALGLNRLQQGPVQNGQQVPNFTFSTFDSQQYNLQDLRGKVVVVNFWASWCTPCEQEAADLESAWQSYKDQGQVVFLGVDYVDTEPEARAYLEKFQISYPNGPDLRTVISQQFRIRGVPETYFIDSEGKLAHSQIGPFSSMAEIKAIIDPLLKQ